MATDCSAGCLTSDDYTKTDIDDDAESTSTKTGKHARPKKRRTKTLRERYQGIAPLAKRALVPPEMLTTQYCPSERWECARFVNWLERQLDEQRIAAFSHIANESSRYNERLANWRLGTRAGVPDYVIVLLTGQCIWIEMKRAERSRVTKAQQQWIDVLAPHASVCYGADSAIVFVERYLTDTHEM